MIQMRVSRGLLLVVSLTAITPGCKSFGSGSHDLSMRKRMSSDASSTKVAAHPHRKKSASDLDPGDAQPGRLSAAWHKIRGHDPNAKQQADMQIAFAQMQESQGATEEAIKGYQEALQLDPDRADAHWRLAILMDQQGRAKQSAMHFREAIAKDPNNANLHADFGYSLYLKGLMEESEVELHKALKIDPENRRAHNNLGLVLTAQRQPEDALREFRKSGCSVAEAHSNLGFALALQGSMCQAKEAYQTALKRDPKLRIAQDGQKSLSAAVAALDEDESLQAARGPQLPEPIEQASLTTFADESDSVGTSSTSRTRRVRPVRFGN